ncbi:glycoside hydrolase family 38 N-terminal domain-containing protein [Cucumibacter marinus]|uniref:glycoside hydrolase family 38 N-terminal domain-containing protein n=1 Tax=Cucumibacter marinus TaxID=1121252 RepID=UPI000402773E|nr:glycoside hydrolase family 38 C-terminal domain-containing protein [Cucumibacter marinus]
MGKIKTIYICNHSHTDIGYTDFQENCFRQHGEFVDQALDLIEKTDDYPAEAQYRWTVETTGPFVRYLRGASADQISRFRHWHEQGRIDIAAMQYNMTPLLDVEQMHRSLYPLRIIRDEFGFNVEAAMQDDVNGVSWLFADLLAELGVNFYTAAVNPIRGARPKPFPGPFHWEGPSGKKVLAWNGYHYLFGRSQAGLGNWDLVDRLLPRWVEQLENDDSYQFDFLYCESTHPVRVDNGPPDLRMADFVREWNSQDRPYKLEFKTVTDFGRMLHAEHGDKIGTQRGDWTDHWTDGPASSAAETGINRNTHALLGMAESIESWLRVKGTGTWSAKRAATAYEDATLYDEHTWGAYTSVEAPDSLFTRSIWNKKAGYAYSAAMEAHDMVARAANTLAAPLGTKGPEGVFNLGDLEPETAFKPSGIDDILVINTLPWEREVIVEEPEPRGGAAPVGVLDTFFIRGSTWGGARPIPPVKRLAGKVPAMGYAFLKVSDGVKSEDLKADGNVIENAHYRVKVDPETGGLLEFFDKAQGHDFAGTYKDWRPGQYIYETVDSEEDRLAIANIDFAHPNFFEGRTDTPWVREVASEVKLSDAVVHEGRASIEVNIQAPGIRSGKVVYALNANQKALEVDWSIDKIEHTEAEAVFVAFPFNLEGADFTVDLNGIPSKPNDDQLDGAAKDWYPVTRWVNVNDGKRGVTMVPVDAPLVHLGGITTGRWARTLEPEGPNIMSWALNNHWLVNFRASQSGVIPLRYRLTTHEGAVDPTSAARFAAEAVTSPIAMRDIKATGARSDSFFVVDDEQPVMVTTKPGEDDRWIAMRFQNLSREAVRGGVRFQEAPRSARAADPIEHIDQEIALQGNHLSVPLEPLEIRTVLVRFPLH